MSLVRAQISYDTLMPATIDFDQELTNRIEELSAACKKNENLVFRKVTGEFFGHSACEHVFDAMRFEVLYKLINASHNLNNEELGKLVKKTFETALLDAAINDVETRGV